MTRPGIEPRSLGPLANIQLIWPIQSAYSKSHRQAVFITSVYKLIVFVVRRELFKIDLYSLKIVYIFKTYRCQTKMSLVQFGSQQMEKYNRKYLVNISRVVKKKWSVCVCVWNNLCFHQKLKNVDIFSDNVWLGAVCSYETKNSLNNNTSFRTSDTCYHVLNCV